jgi:transcriptional regulator with GAF, ATPase, and Fis domain
MQWRLHAQAGDLETNELNGLLHVFQAGGRSDLVAAVARNLIRIANQRADANLRRRSTARFEEAKRAIMRGLEGPQAELHFERTLHLAGNEVRQTRQDSNQDVDWLLECIRRLASSRDRRELLERILDHALERTGARRGYVVIARNQEIETSAARGMDLDREDSGDASISSSVIHAALADGKPISTANAANDERFQDEQSVRHLQLRSVLCVPFADQGVVRGAIYVDNDRADSIFDDDDIRALSVLADPAAVALAQIEERQRIKDLNRQLADKVELQESELVQAREALKRSGRVAPLPGVIGTSPAMLEVAAMVERLAPTDLTVLVTGPSGSGKELIARALHHRSNRADGPLITENTAALPESLLESELFGHKKGAFTGAEQDRDGLFKRAQGGTLFLDEIGDLPMPLQVKLLRVLESGEVRPLGSNETEIVSVRVVAATHQQLADKVQRGEFRKDLFYRLNGGEVSLPALEERLEDLPLLVAHFMEQLSAQYGQRKTVSDDVLAALLTRVWPGQVRELRNEVARLWFLSDEAINNPALIRKPMASMDEANKAPESMLLIDAERIAVERALAAASGRRDQAAKLLGISRSGLYTKLTRLGLD